MAQDELDQVEDLLEGQRFDPFAEIPSLKLGTARNSAIRIPASALEKFLKEATR